MGRVLEPDATRATWDGKSAAAVRTLLGARTVAGLPLAVAPTIRLMLSPLHQHPIHRAMIPRAPSPRGRNGHPAQSPAGLGSVSGPESC